MKIAFIDTLGLCYDGDTLNRRGLGGSESAVILISRELAKLGFDVTVYNDCVSDDCKAGNYNGVLYCPVNWAKTPVEFFDACIVSRSVRPIVEKWPAFTTAKHKVLWMHDTFCEGDEYIEELIDTKQLDEIFTLSDFHTNYVTNADHGKRRMFEVLKNHVFLTRNGINLYHDWVDIKDKDPDLFVYNASVTKGMIPLVTEIWPEVKKQIPTAKLKVIGGYYKFRENSAPDQQEQDWRRLVTEYGNLPLDIEFTGIIKQSEIADILAKASFMIYPAGFPETFGISTLESLAYNTPLITCRFGALEETAVDLACYKIPYPIEPNGLFPHINKPWQLNKFVETVVRAHQDTYLHQQKMYACNQVKDICGWDSVALQWKQHFYHKLGEYMDVKEYRKVKLINTRVRKVFGRRFMNKEEMIEDKQPLYNKISVVTPVYNAEKYIERCIRSVAQQDYSNYTMYIIDDSSTDDTVAVICRTLDTLPRELQKRFIVVENDVNKGAVCNQVETIVNKCGDDIVMLLDGDDWLVNDPSIFDKYNNIYNTGAEFTYGSCWSVADNIPLIAQPYPPEVKKNKTYREYKFNWNMPYTHLRTFKGSLMQGYIHEHGYWAFKCPATFEWLKAGGDTAVFYSMIEYADPDKVVCVPDVVYHYNDANPLNDYKVNAEEQNKTAETVINSKKKILIAIPTARYVECDTFKSIYDLEIPEGYETEFQCFYGYSVAQVRNLIAHWVVNGYDYLFAVDHDVTFPPDTLKKLIEHDKDYVCGVYRQRLDPEVIEIYGLDNLRKPAYSELYGKDLVEIGASGFGCVLVKKEVFVNVGYPYFVYKDAIDHKDTFSEDLDFCTKARDRGHKLYVDPSIVCGHIGTRVFNVEIPTSNVTEWEKSFKNA